MTINRKFAGLVTVGVCIVALSFIVAFAQEATTTPETEPTVTTESTVTVEANAIQSIEPSITTPDALSATSTPNEETFLVPAEEPLVLQPEVYLTINGSKLGAHVTITNLTCRHCDKVSPNVPVKIYYTPWYPNDGPDNVEAVDSRYGAGDFNTAAVSAWDSDAMDWTTEVGTPGHYYFVVIVDPDNINGVYRMHRSEFSTN